MMMNAYLQTRRSLRVVGSEMALSKKRRVMRLRASQSGWICHYCHIPLIPCDLEHILCEEWVDGHHQKGIHKILPTWRGWFVLLPGFGAPTLDHKISLSHGGTHAEDNLLLCCARCNRAKRERDYEQFYAKMAEMRAKNRMEYV